MHSKKCCTHGTPLGTYTHTQFTINKMLLTNLPPHRVKLAENMSYVLSSEDRSSEGYRAKWATEINHTLVPKWNSSQHAT